MMANTVIAIFEKAGEAQTAETHLLTYGILPSQVNTKTASYKSDIHDPDEIGREHDLMDSITAFFKDLFGSDHKEISNYAAAGRHRTIVTVHTETDEEAELVARILDDSGAMDVNETAGSYFPENEKSSQHQFLDDSMHNPAQKHLTDENKEMHKRVSGIKSRIIQRSSKKNIE